MSNTLPYNSLPRFRRPEFECLKPRLFASKPCFSSGPVASLELQLSLYGNRLLSKDFNAESGEGRFILLDLRL